MLAGCVQNAPISVHFTKIPVISPLSLCVRCSKSFPRCTASKRRCLHTFPMTPQLLSERKNRVLDSDSQISRTAYEQNGNPLLKCLQSRGLVQKTSKTLSFVSKFHLCPEICSLEVGGYFGYFRLFP